MSAPPAYFRSGSSLKSKFKIHAVHKSTASLRSYVCLSSSWMLWGCFKVAYFVDDVNESNNSKSSRSAVSSIDFYPKWI